MTVLDHEETDLELFEICHSFISESGEVGPDGADVLRTPVRAGPPLYRQPMGRSEWPPVDSRILLRTSTGLIH